MKASAGRTFPLGAEQEIHWRRLVENPESVTGIWRRQRVSGNLDVERLLAGVHGAVERHEALRIGVSPVDDVPVQWLRDMPERESLVTARSVRCRSEEQFDRYVQKMWAEEMRKGWDLACDYPFSFFLLRYSPTLHVFLSGFSHVAVDKLGGDIVLKQIWQHYDGVPVSPAGAGDYFSAAVRHARRRSDEESAAKHWEGRASSVPPGVRFWGACNRVPREGGRADVYEPFVLDGRELAEMRRGRADARCSEFQWVLTAFAVTVFSLSPLDRIKLTVVVDMRSVAEREMVGMFAMRIPLTIDRKNLGEMLPHVQKQLFRSFSAYRRMDPVELNAALECAAGESGRPCVDDLSINYIPLDVIPPGGHRGGVVISETSNPAGTRFAPAGLYLQVISEPDSLIYAFIADDAIMPPPVREEFSAALRESLAGGFSSTSPDLVGKGSIKCEAGISLVTDADGRVVLVVDRWTLEDAIRELVGVVTAEVLVDECPTGADVIRAHVVVDSALTADAVRNHLAKAARENPLLVVPGVITVEELSRM
ncbi:condensation domain-containing protein [Streptomyces sp. NPDC014734]|uniref:condensation domain-containing protein n=1 Tax=Streptomyces sp. NPDC014734 TaxID=3364886 RepID=UPI0036FD52D9